MSKKKKSKNAVINSPSPTEEISDNIIDFYKSFKPNSDKNIPFPTNFTIEPRIFIEKNVFQEIQNHSTETKDVELCGVLIGELRYDNFGNYLYICGSIRGEKAINSGVNVSFTSETWDYIHEVKEEKYNNYSIIGWYHTHPGFGIFLSDMDKFIQDNFFNLSYQIALVVDPKSSQNGIFTWQEGKIRPLKNCWVGNDYIPLTIGTVGGEETFINTQETIKNDNQNNHFQNFNDNSNFEYKTNNNSFKQAFNYLLCFTLAFVLANIFYAIYTYNYINYFSNKTSQAETREILTQWSTDYSIAKDLNAISDYLNSKLKTFEQISSPSVSISSIQELTKDINTYIKYISNNYSEKQKSYTELIKKIAERNIETQINSEKEIKDLKHMVANSLLIQIEPYLNSLSAQPINKGRIEEAKKVLEKIVSISSEEEKNKIIKNYYWIFNNN